MQALWSVQPEADDSRALMLTAFAASGDGNGVRRVIEADPGSVNELGLDGTSPLCAAAMWGHVALPESNCTVLYVGMRHFFLGLWWINYDGLLWVCILGQKLLRNSFLTAFVLLQTCQSTSWMFGFGARSIPSKRLHWNLEFNKTYHERSKVSQSITKQIRRYCKWGMMLFVWLSPSFLRLTFWRLCWTPWLLQLCEMKMGLVGRRSMRQHCKKRGRPACCFWKDKPTRWSRITKASQFQFQYMSIQCCPIRNLSIPEWEMD